MNSHQPLFLSTADVRRALPMKAAVETMKSAFAGLGERNLTQPQT